MNNDGVALFSTAHPIAPWYRRWWMMLRRPRLSVESLETREIEILDGSPIVHLLGAGMTNNDVRSQLRKSSMTDAEIEQELQAKGKTAPRVTLAHIEGCIAYEYYITGDQIPAITTAVLGAAHPQVPTMVDVTPLACLTLCVLVLNNGFTVTGESACASPENFYAKIGRDIARQKAIDKVWMLEGYLLKERLHREVRSPLLDNEVGPGY